ncbi:TPA: hypothetical protein ACK3PA_004363 [Burkholderia cenocepacia]|uniref:hypothetical protein n=1 Tax=Burkholderia cenocepacia TaxID=95486 RepID=UPI001FB57DFD|nr:hypothetical protein [Burkholderia cenocepacia]
MTEKKTRGRQIHVEMPSDEYDLFKALATEQDLSMQQLVRRCIRAYMEQGSAYQDTHPNLKLVPEEIFAPDYADDFLSIFMSKLRAAMSPHPDSFTAFLRDRDNRPDYCRITPQAGNLFSVYFNVRENTETMTAEDVISALDYQLNGESDYNEILAKLGAKRDSQLLRGKDFTLHDQQ